MSRRLAISVAAISALAAPATFARGTVALVPSVNSLGRAEAVTASVLGTDALSYNPAGLTQNRVSIRLLGVEATVGARRLRAQRQGSDFATLDDALDSLDEAGPLMITATGRALDLAVPYFAATSFVRAESELRTNKASGGVLLETGTDAGVAGGLALRIAKMSFGFAQYEIARAKIAISPTHEQLDALIVARKEEDDQATTDLVKSFSEVRYGGARGSNAGVMYHFWGQKSLRLRGLRS